MQLCVIGAFCASLVVCLAFDLSILYALVPGLLLFELYGLKQGFKPRELARLTLDGVLSIKNILLMLLLVGIMTALWRASGTIAVLVTVSSRLISPRVFLLMTFLVCSGVSALTGTSFGTAATIGTICAAIGTGMNINPLFTGGAILSGAFFGDRCSPVSTSALLVAAVTETDIYGNIRCMLRTALVPFLITCLMYAALGFLMPGAGSMPDTAGLFARCFNLTCLALIPAGVMLALSVFRVNVRLTLAAGILAAVPLCVFAQHMTAGSIIRAMLNGFVPPDPDVAVMMSGGGLRSMIKVTCIVCVSSSYSGLFEKTGILDPAKKAVHAISRKTSPYFALLVSSVLSCMVACNQTLTILLAKGLCAGEYTDKDRLAVDIEDSAVIIAPLIPWSIAGAVPLAAVGAPQAAIFTSFYLILIMLCRLLMPRIDGVKTLYATKGKQ